MRPDVVAGARPGHRHEYLRTSCGRDLTVGRLALGDDRHPAQRIFVDLGECPGCDGTSWAGLTVTEAGRVAWALLSQAAAAQRESEAQAGPAGRLTARHAGGDAYVITMGGHACSSTSRRPTADRTPRRPRPSCWSPPSRRA
jgi:hypothetical protein